ncbi:MAG: hypothetical protein E7633_02900 [Ruminococcaceae bacterium]|nr:hypothetical protein [Oscillospiraceae bacterium]
MKKSALLLKRTMCVFLTVVMLLCSFAACNKKEEKPNEVDKVENIVFASAGISDYTVVYAAADGRVIRQIASEILLEMKNISKTDVVFTDDSSEAVECEILVGNTNRPETATAIEKMGDSEYIITMIGKKLVLYSENADAYEKMFNYLKIAGFTDTQFALSSDFSYSADMITKFVADEKIDGNTRIDITFNYNHSDAQAGIFIGREDDLGIYGYDGYCVLVNDGTITFYRMGAKLAKMGSKKIGDIKKGKDFSIRLEVEGKIARAFFLDDAEGFEPWPEIELLLDNCSGASVGYIELSGYGTQYKDFSVKSFDAEKPANTYTNAVYENYADPEVLFYDGKYYLYGTGGSGGYDVHVSSDLVNWRQQPKKAVSPNLWGISSNYWAPDVEYINGKFYMVVTCSESIGIAVSDSPLGPFKEYHDKVLYKSAIDGHIFVDDDGKIYLYYVHFNNGNNIAGVQLDENMKPIESTWKQIITPVEEWETRDGKITEGPYMLKHNGIYYLTYSGSHYINPEYAVGYATCDTPLGNFDKYDLNPIMVGTSQVYGAGHHCFTTTKDGSQLIIVYHTHKSTSTIHSRKVCIDLARFSPVEGDIDRLEIYGPNITPQPVPNK